MASRQRRIVPRDGASSSAAPGESGLRVHDVHRWGRSHSVPLFFSATFPPHTGTVG